MVIDHMRLRTTSIPAKKMIYTLGPDVILVPRQVVQNLEPKPEADGLGRTWGITGAKGWVDGLDFKTRESARAYKQLHRTGGVVREVTK